MCILWFMSRDLRGDEEFEEWLFVRRLLRRRGGSITGLLGLRMGDTFDHDNYGS